MKKTSVRLAVGMLAISILVLASGTAFGITDEANIGNVTVTGTTTTTYTATETIPNVTFVEKTNVQTPEATEATPKKIEATPEKTPGPAKSPGFESILTIATILAAICVFGTKRR